MGENGPILGHFGPKWRHRPKFRESAQIFFTLKVFKNYFSQVYELKKLALFSSNANLKIAENPVFGHFAPNTDILNIKALNSTVNIFQTAKSHNKNLLEPPYP